MSHGPVWAAQSLPRREAGDKGEPPQEVATP